MSHNTTFVRELRRVNLLRHESWVRESDEGAEGGPRNRSAKNAPIATFSASSLASQRQRESTLSRDGRVMGRVLPGGSERELRVALYANW